MPDVNEIIERLREQAFYVPAEDADHVLRTHAECAVHAAADARTPPARIVARWFHEEYERLAPDYGYRTRTESAVPWEDVPEANRDLMIATVENVLRRFPNGGTPGEPPA